MGPWSLNGISEPLLCPVRLNGIIVCISVRLQIKWLRRRLQNAYESGARPNVRDLTATVGVGRKRRHLASTSNSKYRG